MKTEQSTSMGETERLRMAMVDQLRDWDAVRTEPVEAAMRAVPRHVFVPDAPLEQAYCFDPVVTHRNGEGVAVSSASAPGVVAEMLEQLNVRPGQHVLEIGAGTGYNAALLAYLTGPTGQVTTVEYDEVVAQSARRALPAVGFGGVSVICADGALGYASNAPYDRIIVTAGAWDVPPTWPGQLAEGGRLVVPLRMRGLTRTVALERDGQILRSRSAGECGFIPMRGADEVAEQNIRVGGEDPALVVRIDDGHLVNAGSLGRALDYPATVSWTGVTAPLGMFRHLDFWLATLDGFCRVLVSADAVERGMLVQPAHPWGSMGVSSFGAVSYLTLRACATRDDGAPACELGVCAYGPDGAALAGRVTGRIRDWDRDAGQQAEIVIEVHPIRANAAHDAWLVIDKRHCRIVIRAHWSGQQQQRIPTGPDRRGW